MRLANKQDRIIFEIKSGSRPAFRRFFDDFYPVLCSFAMRYLDDRFASEDVVQDLLLKYWETRQRYSSMREVKGFLYAAVRNRCINILKKKQIDERYSRFVLENDKESFEEDVFEHEVLALLYTAVGNLPGQMKRIIEYSMTGMRNADIAKEMNIAEGSLHKLKKIAYRKLREVLNNPFSFFFLSFF
ncbi:RNA polymerase sigma-70 factor [Alistipes sp. OttesenSCG-928-B03]|nr:RNA polymerase sigma-70 factor [Alistipes sp. OttesenSCG-928-B03]